MTFAVTLPGGNGFQGAAGVAVAPDGSRIAYAASRDGTTRLFVHPLNELDSEPVAGTEGAAAPFFSPDGRWVGFFAGGALKKVPVAGGTPTIICPAGYRRGAAWLEGDVIVFASNPINGLMHVPASGGTPALLTDASESESHRWPEALPGGKGVVFTISPLPVEDVSRMKLAVIDLESGEQRVLSEGAFPRYLAPGYLTFVLDDALWLARFDPTRSTIDEPARLMENPLIRSGGFSEYDVGDDGTLAFRPSLPDAESLGWVDRAGHFVRITEPGFAAPRLSPDGQRIAGIRAGAVWVHDLTRGTSTRITSPPSVGVLGGTIAWSRDGQRILFTNDRRAQYEVAADGGSPPVRLTRENGVEVTGEWLPGGTRLFAAWTRPADFDIWVHPPSGPARPIVSSAPNSEVAPSLSPDGRWLAYRAGVAGLPTPVYVQPYPAGRRVQVSVGSANGIPRWAHDSRALFFMSETLEMIEVRVDPQSRTVFGPPQVLFRDARLGVVFDVDRSGRFLMATIPEAQDIIVKVNWLEHLRRTLPGLR